ncbi:hypothetical protein KC571_04285 [candidate division WWE3 bacterium]|uniref:Uncharacterized protein n=1 Tax=candidate division WWE3 bacterium TaxID=2053526 RepID=A0A955RPN6_UNCKA|nr:hypothetical protein [candidate division WWE3 bacterium]
MNQKGFAAFIVIAVFFGIIIGTGLIWYQQSREETQSESTTDLVTDSSEKQLTLIEIKIHQYSSNPDLAGDLLTLSSKTSFKNVKVEENGNNSVQVSSDDGGTLFISAGKSESGGVHEYIPDAAILDNEAFGIQIYRINSDYEQIVYKEYVGDNSEDNYSYYVGVGDGDLGCNSNVSNYCGPQELDLEQTNIVVYCKGDSSTEIEFCDEIVSNLYLGTNTVQPQPTPFCSSGFAYYENDYFSICYPSKLTLFEEREVQDQNDNESSTRVFFSNSERNDALRIESDGYFDSGPVQCLEESDVTVDGYDATRYIFSEELSPCGSITYMMTEIIRENQGNYLIGYQSSDKEEYEIIEQSLKILNR